MSALAYRPDARRQALAAEMMSAALRYAGLGLPVFPCRPDKRPYTSHGFKDASTDPAQVGAWWSAWPLAMIGMPTGQRSGWVVLDIDAKGSVDGFATLREQGRTITADIMARTPSGGAHVYYPTGERRVRSSAGRIGPGLDVRGDGGYIILPPSRPTLDGPDYGWEDGYDRL